MFKDIPVDVGIIYEGERIRKEDMHVEFGGGKVPYKLELVQVRPPNEVTDGKIEIIGPDIKDLKEGGSYPLGIYVEVAGEKLEKDLEGVFERQIHAYSNYIEGFMHLNQRYDIWIRLGKASYRKGLNSFKFIGLVLQRLYKAEMAIIEKIQIKFITDEKKVHEFYETALKIYEARDARARGLKDEDVNEFYGCVLCQSFAPTHMCVIAPSRTSICGSINWFDAQAAVRVNPKGPNFKIEKGECLDPVKGEYSGVNERVKEKSLGEVKQVFLHSIFGNPQTSCGCFEAIAFYVPEVDGVGIVNRDFKGLTVNGLPFSTLASETGGGRQNEGLIGIAIEYMRSPKFLQADGGWKRVVWFPANIKERVKDAIPPDLLDKIATENDAKSMEDLKKFLETRDHPVVSRWKVAEAPPAPVAPVIQASVTEKAVSVIEVPGALPPMVIPTEGLRIVLKGVKIHVDKLIIRKADEKE